MTRVLVILLFISGSNWAISADKEKPPSRNQVFGAIAYHAASNNHGWATDRKTSREARLEALKLCGHPECVIVGTVTRGCAALARNPKKFVVQKGANQKEAETKALSRCGAGCEIVAWTCTR